MNNFIYYFICIIDLVIILGIGALIMNFIWRQ